ncbi:hypothetical protein CWE12_00400 [Aliidiomarina sedimenti]|uniref:Tetratricopeptide repeat protein n=1 Tax=Aliidiomarina sedimenti TaxID=1933879 RepID=A0ABY0C1I3_9GAMM|nr:hypothetical protein [Aliidiomarina sedimenti]RUO31498.1 hypothetical protein CWE12_00400 [Aliidiomarina sedimenti]
MLRLLTIVLFTGLAAAPAQAQSFIVDTAEPYEEVVEQLRAQDLDAAKDTLDALSDEHGNTGDYHYLQGLIKMTQLQDAGALRSAMLARGLRRDLENALETDPDHALAHFGLVQFHRFAPGLLGGSAEKLSFHKQRLVELDSPLQFPAEIPRAQMEDNEQDEIALYQAWLEHTPDSFDAHFEFSLRLIALQRYQAAQQQLQRSLELAADSVRSDVLYQQVRLAAVADSDVTPAFRQQAYQQGIEMLENAPQSLSHDPAWLQLRLAQVETKLTLHEQAHTRLQQVIELADRSDERLQSEIEQLRQALDAKS